MDNQITEDELWNRIVKRKPALAKFDRQEVLNRVFQRKPELRDSIIYAPRQELADNTLESDAPQYTQAGAMQTVDWFKKPGNLAMTAGLLAAPFTGGQSIPAAIGTQALIGGGGEAARQILKGGEETSLESAKKIGLEAAKGGAFQSLFAAPSLAYGGLRNYIASSPRVLNAIAQTIGAVTKKDIKPNTILEGIQRSGLPEKMGQIEKATEKVKYAGDQKVANLAMSEMKTTQAKAVDVLGRTQARLKNQRILLGKQIEKVDNELVSHAKNSVNKYGVDANNINLEGIGQKMVTEFYEPIKNNPILKDTVGIKKLEDVLVNISKKPNITIDEAIKTKRLIANIFEDFSNKGRMSVADNDTITLAMKGIRKELDTAIKSKATQLGFKGYSKTYNNFSKFADDYDSELLPMFGSKESRMAKLERVKRLTDQVNSGDLNLEVVKGTKAFVPNDKTGKVMDDLTDYLVLNSVYKDMSGAPSSMAVGLARMGLEPITKSLVKVRAPQQLKAYGSSAVPALMGAFSSPEEVKQAYKSGQISREQAESELKNNHGMK